jgi:hypothetical protein
MSSFDVGNTLSTRSASPLLSISKSIAPSTTPNALKSLGRRSPSDTSEPPPKKKRLVRAESTWDYFREPEGDEERYYEKKRRLHYCKQCSKYSTSISSNARYHLEHTHFIHVIEGPIKADIQRQQAIQVAF